MKASILMASVLALIPVPAFGGEPGHDWISIGRVERLLQREGYRLIEIEPKDDYWEGEATRHGQTWDFKMSPKTGGIISINQDTDWNSIRFDRESCGADPMDTG